MNPIAAFKAASLAVKALVVLAIVPIIAGLLGYHFWQASKAADAKNAVVTGQLGAATASGKDAISSTGNQADAESAADAITRNNADAIDHANGANAIVAPQAQDAGLRALCQRPSYRGSSGCAAYK
jgi:hypothetical protein